eukprot:3631051-Rhodomonas_salina.2
MLGLGERDSLAAFEQIHSGAMDSSAVWNDPAQEEASLTLVSMFLGADAETLESSVVGDGACDSSAVQVAKVSDDSSAVHEVGAVTGEQTGDSSAVLEPAESTCDSSAVHEVGKGVHS